MLTSCRDRALAGYPSWCDASKLGCCSRVWRIHFFQFCSVSPLISQICPQRRGIARRGYFTATVFQRPGLSVGMLDLCVLFHFPAWTCTEPSSALVVTVMDSLCACLDTTAAVAALSPCSSTVPSRGSPTQLQRRSVKIKLTKATSIRLAIVRSLLQCVSTSSELRIRCGQTYSSLWQQATHIFRKHPVWSGLVWSRLVCRVSVCVTWSLSRFCALRFHLCPRSCSSDRLMFQNHTVFLVVLRSSFAHPLRSLTILLSFFRARVSRCEREAGVSRLPIFLARLVKGMLASLGLSKSGLTHTTLGLGLVVGAAATKFLRLGSTRSENSETKGLDPDLEDSEG